MFKTIKQSKTLLQITKDHKLQLNKINTIKIFDDISIDFYITIVIL